MRHAAPADEGFVAGAELDPLGRAARWELEGGRELWRLPPEDRAVAVRLRRLGASGVGGFIAAGEDDDGVWLVRAAASPTLGERLRGKRPMPWRDAVLVAQSVADALAGCEQQALFPGPLAPDGVRIDDEAATPRADALVHDLVGAPPLAAPSPRWSPPEQTGGQVWNNAANRYVLGMMLYRLLAGEHPFAAKGLRLGLEEQQRGAPPLPDAIAAELPPGLQSLCLKLLEPDPGGRPESAAGVAGELERFLDEPELRAALPRAGREHAPLAAERKDTPLPVAAPTLGSGAAAPSRVKPARARARGWLAALATLGAGLALAVLAMSLVPDGPAPPHHTRAPLVERSTAAGGCATCHTRQSAEWTRSVMAHSVKSPMFQALEMLVEEQVGQSDDCPDGAGILRSVDPGTACRDRVSGLPVTGSGGELWCVNCHAPRVNLSASLPAWNAIDPRSRSREPLRDLLPASTMEGIGCGFCHQVGGPVHPGGARAGRYEGNPTWTSSRTGQVFSMRPEDQRGVFGISNSGYWLDPSQLLGTRVAGVHGAPDVDAVSYLASSRFCGACHDVRLFGTDVLGARKGEHFKRLRNAYSEWRDYAAEERRSGRRPASCQGCHMSRYPGVCAKGAAKAAVPGTRSGGVSRSTPTALRDACPPGTHFRAERPGSRAKGFVATASGRPAPVSPHYFSGVDIPLTPAFGRDLIDEPEIDAAGIPLGARQRRDLLLGAALRFEIDRPGRRGSTLEIPMLIENIGAGHRIPAGFSQERELWVHLEVTDAEGRLVYEVGRVDRPDEDLHDKRFLRVNTSDRLRDGRGRPQGLFGADVADGRDVPRWSPSPEYGGTRFHGRGLINFQNGFLRCVVCIGRIGFDGSCQPLPGQESARADRYADGSYDIDTGECGSNLSGRNALFETYFPVGALDATRGAVKGPDAIIDTRSLAPRTPVTYTYELPVSGTRAPFRIEAELLFRAFPPYLIRAFADYEARQAARGLRPSGPLITDAALERLDVVELRRVRAVVP